MGIGSFQFQLPDWLTWYKKPKFLNYKDFSEKLRKGAEGERSRPSSPAPAVKAAVPKQLALERVLENRTCSPMSLYDFYMYLKYIEYSPENLEFYIWFKNYQDNYGPSKTEATGGRIPLVASAEDENADPLAGSKTLDRIAAMLGADTSCSRAAKPRAQAHKKTGSSSTASSTDLEKQEVLGQTSCAHGNCDAAGGMPHLAPVMEQQAEINSIIKTFLLPGSEKELNIPSQMRTQALVQLRRSCDPVHLAPIAEHCYQLLHDCSHRNFVRLGISNGTFETLCIVTSLGIVLTIAGFVCVLLLALTPDRGAHSRWTVFGSWPLWWVGMSLVLSGLRGSCFFLLLFTRRQALPWERFDDSDSALAQQGALMKFVGRLMIIDRKYRVSDKNLRSLQHKIVAQSMFGGAIFAFAGVLIFIFLPCWRETI